MVPQSKYAAIMDYETAFARFVPSLQPFYDDPRPFALEPFQIFGNLWYVGDRKVCMHLIDTGDGLILFDCGYGHTTDLIEDSIRGAGFDPADVKILIISHGHFDHFGSGNELRQKYGWKVYMSQADTQLLRENPRRALIHLGPCPDDEVCWPDVEIPDGGVIELGNTKITCILAPGHTYGTMAFFFDVSDGEKTLRAGYYGGTGVLTMYDQYCLDYGMPVGKVSAMKRTIQRLLQEHVDITLGNHPSQNCTLEKRQRMLDCPGENPFLDPKSWSAFLHVLEARRQEFEALGYGS